MRQLSPAAARSDPERPAPDEFGEDVLVEMANLDEEDTRVPGTIFISTRLGSHGPRVKWYPGAPSRTAACLIVSIGPDPKVRDDFLPSHVSRPAIPLVTEWVRANHEALMEFWNEGESWNRRRVSAFLDSLKPVQR